jgi:hypothetical protein
MIRDTGQHVPQITFGIDAIQLSTADRTVDRRGTLSTAIEAPLAQVCRIKGCSILCLQVLT